MERVWYLIITLLIYGIVSAIITGILEENKKENNNESISYHILIGMLWPFLVTCLLCISLFAPFYYIAKFFVKSLKK